MITFDILHLDRVFIVWILFLLDRKYLAACFWTLPQQRHYFNWNVFIQPKYESD